MSLSTSRAAATRPTPSARPTDTRPAAARLARAAFEALEDRRLFTAVVVGPVPTQAGSPGGAATTVDLGTYFNDNAVENVQVTTPLGNYRLRLLEAQKPITVANFMKYVTSGRYNNTIVHRAAALLIQTPDIIQGGGFSAADPTTHITTDAPIVNEYTTNGVINNSRGTIAMAKTSDPDSATSEWFVNVQDTTTALNNTQNSGGFTVFGNVADADLPVIDAIAALPRFDLDTAGVVNNGALAEVPLRNYTDADLTAKKIPTAADNYVTETATRLPDLTYTVASSNPDVAVPTVGADGVLSLAYGSAEGQADITVTATAADGSTVQSAFAVASGAQVVQLGGDTGNSAVTFTDADGTVGTLTLKGPGAASVRIGGTATTQAAAKGKLTVAGTGATLDLVTLTGTTAATTVTLSGKGGDKVVSLAGLSADGPLKSISAKGVALTGGLSTTGAVGAVTLGSATGATINLGGTTADAAGTLTVGAMVDSDITTNAPMKAVKLASATSTNDDPEVIAAVGGLDALTVTGDLASDVVLSGDHNLRSLKVGGTLTGDVTAHQLFAVSVKGAATGSTVTATHDANEYATAAEANAKANQAIGSFKVGGAMSGVSILSAGSVGSVSAGSMTDSTVFAGPTGTTLPLTLAALSSPATLGSLKTRSLAGTLVAARFLGKLSVGTVATGTGGQATGFAADRITQLAGTLSNGKKLALKNADVQADATALLGTTGGVAVTTPGTDIGGGAGTVFFPVAADSADGGTLTILLV
ncbi:MAG: hypothetical protein JWO31_517 [Phycisphaerales bacterium]|nr:hypothetical protein [Phycisphaerales bacterium]